MSDIPTDAVNPASPTQPRPPRIPPQNTDGDTMERLFQALFYRIAVLYARAIPKHVRRLSESAILVMVKSFFLPTNKEKTSVFFRQLFV